MAASHQGSRPSRWRWRVPIATTPGGQPAGQRARILWADDNADMREYVSRLLGGRFDVQAVADGQAALEAARANPPDLVLSDVMMPRLDGFGLLRALRADPQLREVPIILLSARAGEESRIEGMEAGADDYLIKPFSARELVARVETHVKMSRLRREADAARRESERRLSALVSSLPGMAYRCRNDHQRTMEFVSDGVISITGYTPEELTSGRTHWAQLQHPDDVAWTWEAVQSAAREHRPFQFEYRIRHKDGSERWVSEQGQGVYNGTDEPVAFEGFITDVTERKRTEAASATLAAIVESSDDAIISKSLDGVITSWNKSAERIFGYTASEAVGQPITMLIPPDRLDEEPNILERLKRGERVDHFETIRVRKDGSRLDISLTISPVKDADGRIIGASKVARDITERKQVEAALRVREQELADFFDNAALGLHRVGPDGIILRVNQAELTLLGYTRDEYVGHHIAEFHADQHVIEDLLRRLHAGEELHDYEARLVCKDGTIKHALIDSNVLWEQGQFIHTRCFTRDITAQKQAEALLQQAHATLEQRVEERTALLALIRDVTRAANEASSSAEALQYAVDRLCASTGWPIGHVYLAVAPGAERWAPTAIWHLDDPERFVAFQQATQGLECAAGEDLIGRVGARGQPEWRRDVATDPAFQRRHAAQAAGLSTGVAWPVLVGPEVAGVLEFYATEALAPNTALLEAMTQIGTQLGRAVERERAAAQAQQQQEALLQQEKLAAMSTMLASVAHELNNPLATILLQAELVGDDVRGGPLAEPVTEIAQAAARCERLVRQFLTLARQHTPERTAVAFNTLVTETVEILAYPLRVDNVTVHLHLDDQVPLLWGDPHQLQQVLINLLTNAQQALRAAPGAREVTCTTQYDPAQHRITLAVADTGPGISAALQGRIFEPFFTTKPPGVGTGLGLPLCRGIVEAHGGTLEVTSAPGQGATFRLTLPVGAVPASLPTPPPVDEALAVRGGTILVVDDEPSLAKGLARLLQRDGHTVDTVADGRQALARLETRAYDCILCDVRMPELDGPSLYRLLERQQPHLCQRLIFLTGDTLEPATQAFLEQSGAPCLTKPFPIAEARRAIQRILLAVAPSPPWPWCR